MPFGSLSHKRNKTALPLRLHSNAAMSLTSALHVATERRGIPLLNAHSRLAQSRVCDIHQCERCHCCLPCWVLWDDTNETQQLAPQNRAYFGGCVRTRVAPSAMMAGYLSPGLLSRRGPGATCWALRTSSAISAAFGLERGAGSPLLTFWRAWPRRTPPPSASRCQPSYCCATPSSALPSCHRPAAL